MARKLGVEMARKNMDLSLVVDGRPMGKQLGYSSREWQGYRVIPEVLNKLGIVYSLCDELVVTNPRKKGYHG